MPRQTSPVKIIKAPDAPIAVEILEQAVVDIAYGMRRINETRLSREAIVTLIKDKTGYTKSTIHDVLNNLDQLEKIWLKPKKK